MHACCRDLVRTIPWESVYGASPEEGDDWRRWSTAYEPQAGVVNFYRLGDSLMAHTDQSEVDAVRPLVSFRYDIAPASEALIRDSLGHSAVFLVGGTTRETIPLPIFLRSGDGLLLSGSKGRRVFHGKFLSRPTPLSITGLPRVLPDTLPDYLSASSDDSAEWKLCAATLAQGLRLNVNVRQVFV